MAYRPNKPQKEPGTNRKNLENALEAWNRPMIDFKDPHAVEERIKEYLEHCMDADMAPSVSGCANWLRVSISTVEGWYRGTCGTPEHQRIVGGFYLTLQQIWEEDMHEGNINPVSGIFIGKVRYGYQENNEITINHKTTVELSSADLIAQAKLLPGAEKIMLPSSKPEIVDVEAVEIKEPQKEKVEYHGHTLEIDTPKILDDLPYVDDKYYEKAVKKKPGQTAENN